MKWSIQTILIHVLAWTVFLMLPIIASPKFSFFGPLDYGAPEVRNLIGSALMVIFFYANYYYFIPALYHRKKYLPFTLVVLLCFLFIAIIPSVVHPDMAPQPAQMPPGSFAWRMPPQGNIPQQSAYSFHLFQFESTILKFIIVFVLSILIKTNELWKKAQLEKQVAELSFLRLQVNPHFLFNTLNSIYSLAITRSESTPTAIVKLSELMRYVTSEVNTDFVPLVKEIAYVSNYADLQKIRLGSTVQIHYQVSGKYDEDRIAPLLLIPFVENAFKYGVNPEKSSVIAIDIVAENHWLRMTVFNKKTYRKNDLTESGIGLSNVRKRLQLIYPLKHTLTIQDTEENFNIELTLHLI